MGKKANSLLPVARTLISLVGTVPDTCIDMTSELSPVLKMKMEECRDSEKSE